MIRVGPARLDINTNERILYFGDIRTEELVNRYPDGMTVRPLTQWPGAFPAAHVGSPFSAPLSTTLDELDRELRHLGSGRTNAPSVLEIAFQNGDFRIDGMPRATAKPAHPGVVLYIESRFGQLSYPAARFTTWQDNLRAVTLGLNGLRRLDRYGITPGSEQYTGWTQLPAAGTTTVTTTGAADAERFLRDLAGEYDAPLDKVYRAARRSTHPDRNDGDHTAWNTVEAIAETLRRSGRLS